MLRLLEVLSYEGMPITVLEAAGDAWVAATEVGRALGLAERTVRQVVQKNPGVFEPLTMTLDGLWREGVGMSRADPVKTGNEDSGGRKGALRIQEQASTLFLNYSGVLAVLLKLDTLRVKNPDARAKVTRFFHWALNDLKRAMLGRALPAGAGAAPTPPLLPPKYLSAYRAFLCHVRDMPTPLLVQVAATFGIIIDPAGVEAERAVLARPLPKQAQPLSAAAAAGDLVARFLADPAAGVVVGVDHEVRKEALYQRFSEWCASAGEVLPSRTYFNRGIVRHTKAREVHKGNVGRFWRGIGIVPTIGLNRGGAR
jgi:hypothetical protein